jgi:hypothetical protein
MQHVRERRVLVWKPEKMRPLEDVGVYGREIIDWLLRIGWKDLNWTDLAQKEEWRGAANTVMNIQLA